MDPTRGGDRQGFRQDGDRVKRFAIERLVDAFVEDELSDMLKYAFGHFSGGAKLEEADAHFATGCAHLSEMRPKVIEIITKAFPESSK